MAEEKKKISVPKILQWILKILLSILALYLVYRKINKQDFISIITDLDWAWLIPAIILFNISKIFSSVRLNGLLNNIGIETDHTINLKLYYQGMFYNLFLPGGIGGDAYKTYIIKKGSDVPLKKIVGTMLYDRVSGLIMLIFISCILAYDLLERWKLFAMVIGAVTIPLGYLFTRFLFSSHIKNYRQSQLLSFAVQISQVLSVICILKALQVKFVIYFSYLFLFMISSIAAVIPITIGGAGAREMVFLYGKKLLNISAETGIAVGLIFFMITAGSSFIGVIFKTKRG
jgi:uncharacterized membrane protein YbhN (UPF0104 family)